MGSHNGLGWKGPSKIAQLNPLPWAGTPSTAPGCQNLKAFGLLSHLFSTGLNASRSREGQPGTRASSEAMARNACVRLLPCSRGDSTRVTATSHTLALGTQRRRHLRGGLSRRHRCGGKQPVAPTLTPRTAAAAQTGSHSNRRGGEMVEFERR